MNDRVALADYPLALADGTIVGYIFIVELYRGPILLSTRAVHCSRGELDALVREKHYAVAFSRYTSIRTQLQEALDARAAASAASAACAAASAPDQEASRKA